MDRTFILIRKCLILFSEIWQATILPDTQRLSWFLSIYRINAKWRCKLDRWLLAMGESALFRPTKRTKFNRSIESAWPVNLIPVIVQSETGPRRRRSCSKPVEDYQTAKRCFVVTNNKHISSGGQRLLHVQRGQKGERIKQLIYGSRRLMMDFKSADVDSTKPSRSRGHRGRTDRRKKRNNEVERLEM